MIYHRIRARLVVRASMRWGFSSLCLLLMGFAPAWADDTALMPGFHADQMPVTGGTQYVRVGGAGPAVVLLHGFGDSGDMWWPVAAVLVKTHTVVIPDLRGMGLSSHPEGGYRKVAQAKDLARILDRLNIGRFELVTHDIGNMVGFALAAQYPDRVQKWVVMDAPLPGLGGWDSQLTNPKVWHFNFRGPDVERLVAGRERILLDRFYNDMSANPAAIDDRVRNHYAALYARPGAIHNAFGGQFASFTEDAADNRKLLQEGGKLKMPVLAVGGDHSYGEAMVQEISAVATDVRGAVIAQSGHWIMEEQPQQAVRVITSFIDPNSDLTQQARLTAVEIERLPAQTGGAGTSGMPGVSTRLLFGDPKSRGPYSIELRVAPNTSIRPHSHRDSRSAVVVSGSWSFGYGIDSNAAAMKELNAGGFYVEPANVDHFARSGPAGARVIVSGEGPSDTRFAE